MLGSPHVMSMIESIRLRHCEIILPKQLSGFFDAKGYLPPAPNDQRRFPRAIFRSVAALWHRQTIPALPRENQWYKVYTRDLSRGGLGFLHSEQLYPSEILAIVLPDGQPRGIRITRCLRLGEKCYEHGASFVEPPDGIEMFVES